MMSAGRWRTGRPNDRGPHLVGETVKVWWNDDHGGRFYEGTVVEYNPDTDMFKVKYEDSGDDCAEPYEEKLDEQWQVWDGPPRRTQAAQAHSPTDGASPEDGSSVGPSADDSLTSLQQKPFRQISKATYSDMIVQAVRDMAEKDGSSLWSIRKWMLQHYPETTKKQKAVFNSLTKKTVQKLESDKVLMRKKGHYRFTWDYLHQLQKSEGGTAGFAAIFAGYGLAQEKPTDRKSRFSGEALLALDHNRELRREWEKAIERRNAYLFRYRAYVEPFLPDDRNFFTKLEQHEKERREELERLFEEEKTRLKHEQDEEREAAVIEGIENERLMNCQRANEAYLGRVLGQPQPQPQLINQEGPPAPMQGYVEQPSQPPPTPFAPPPQPVPPAIVQQQQQPQQQAPPPQRLQAPQPMPPPPQAQLQPPPPMPPAPQLLPPPPIHPPASQPHQSLPQYFPQHSYPPQQPLQQPASPPPPAPQPQPFYNPPPPTQQYTTAPPPAAPVSAPTPETFNGVPASIQPPVADSSAPAPPLGGQYAGLPPPQQLVHGVPMTAQGAAQMGLYHQNNLDLRAISLDGGPEVEELMVKMGFISEQDRHSGTPLGISGKPLDRHNLLPPLEVSPDGYLLMQDRDIINTVLDSGPFVGYMVVWPGSRVPLNYLPKESEKALIAQSISWQHVYWLQRVPHPQEPAGRREPNVLALRLSDGRWMPHRYSLMRITQKFAEVKRIPINNQVVIPYRDHRTGQVMHATRDYCWVSRYAEAVRRCFKSRVEKDMGLFQRFQELVDEYWSEPIPRPWHKNGGGGSEPSLPSSMPQHLQIALPGTDDDDDVGGGAGLVPSPQAMSMPQHMAHNHAFEASMPNGAAMVSEVPQQQVDQHEPDSGHEMVQASYAHENGGAASVESGDLMPLPPPTFAPQQQEAHSVPEPVYPTPAPAPIPQAPSPIPTYQPQGHSPPSMPPGAVYGSYSMQPQASPNPSYPGAYTPLTHTQAYPPPTHAMAYAPSTHAPAYPPYNPPPTAAWQPQQQQHPHYQAPTYYPPPPSYGAPPPVATPVQRDPVPVEIKKWMQRTSQRIRARTLREAMELYSLLITQGRFLPAELVQPIRKALDAARACAAEITQYEPVDAGGLQRQQMVTDGALYGDGSVGVVKEEGVEVDGEGEDEDGLDLKHVPEEKDAAGKEQKGGKPEKRVALKPIESLEHVQMLSPSPTISVELHEHQVEGVSWLIYMYRHAMPAILGDQMGLGKTLQSIAFLAYLKDVMKVQGPHLVVAPLSVLSNWLSEIERFCPSMRAVRFHGPKNERNRIKQQELWDVRTFDVCVTSFEMLTSEANWFRRKYFWRVLIIDEGHRLKNEKSQLSAAVRKVPAFYRLLLTGTPLQNNLRELWALFHYLLVDVFPPATADAFGDAFDPIKGNLDMDRMKQARALLSVLMLRRRKDQIKMTLPPKTELVITCGLTDMQRAWYKRILTGVRTDLIASGKTGDMGDADWRKLLNILLQLRKVCNHPYLMSNTGYYSGQEMVEASGKLKVLDRMLPKLKDDGHRVLLFSQFTSMLDILEDFCMLRGYEYARLDGSTNRVQRRLDLRRYNAANSPLFIFLISTRAGGLGLNLASADTVILYDSDWNPQVDLQAMERAHRIGQIKPVRVYRLVVRKSVEERMVSRAHKKLFLNEMVAEKDRDQEEVDDVVEPDEEEVPGVALKEDEEENIAAMAKAGSNSAMAKDEVARLIRTGVTALFEADGRKEMSEDELDVLLGRKEGSVAEVMAKAAGVGAAAAVGEEVEDDEQAISKYWQSPDALKLEEVDLRQLDDVVYKKADNSRKGTYKRPEEQGFSLEDLELGARKRKQRLVMVDGTGTGYGGAVPVLVDEYGNEDDEPKAPQAPPVPKRMRRDFKHETDCFICKEPLVESEKQGGRKKQKDLQLYMYPVRCGHCPKVYHGPCLSRLTGDKLSSYASCSNGSSTMVCPHHKCTMCNRNTAAAGGLLFRCVDCPRSFCEDCLDDEGIESMGRWPPMEALNYISKQAYWVRCQTCMKKACGDLDGGDEQEDPVSAVGSESEEATEAVGVADYDDGATPPIDGGMEQVEIGGTQNGGSMTDEAEDSADPMMIADSPRDRDAGLVQGGMDM